MCRFSEKPVLEGIGRDITLNIDDDKNKLGPKRNHQGWLLSRHTNDDRLCCFVCGSTDSLWICMICGHIGCGRYQDAHAYRHYEETSHLFALEIDTQRVWDYVGDGYVHRLIQNAVDGKLVELPGIRNDHLQHSEDEKINNNMNDHQRHYHQISSGSSNNNRNHNNNDGKAYSSLQIDSPMIESSSTNNRRNSGITNQHYDNRIKNNVWGEVSSSSSIRRPKTVSSSSIHNNHHPRDNDIDTMQQEKINAMSIEYTALLTSQLESQRIYYEDQLNALVKQLSNLTAKQNCLQNSIQEEVDHQQILVAETKELTHEWKLAQTNKNKLDQLSQTWKEKYESARLSWEEEKKVEIIIIKIKLKKKKEKKLNIHLYIY